MQWKLKLWIKGSLNAWLMPESWHSELRASISFSSVKGQLWLNYLPGRFWGLMNTWKWQMLTIMTGELTNLGPNWPLLTRYLSFVCLSLFEGHKTSTRTGNHKQNFYFLYNVKYLIMIQNTKKYKLKHGHRHQNLQKRKSLLYCRVQKAARK